MRMTITMEGKAKVNAEYNGQFIRTDQPVMGGGEGSAPAPFDLFLASIGTCAGIYVKSFCDQRGIPTDEIKIYQEMIYDKAARRIGTIKLEIELPADFPEKYKGAVINAAELCAVKKYMHNPPEFEIYSVIKK
jgi:ribosomal protein S12 methylthiotransferase accessory factor